MTELLGKHTEVVNGERRWRQDSDLKDDFRTCVRWPYPYPDVAKELVHEVRSRLGAILVNELGFKGSTRGSVSVYHLGEPVEEGLYLSGRVEITLWEKEELAFGASTRSLGAEVKNRFRTKNIKDLDSLCGLVRMLWSDQSREDAQGEGV